jgi:D-alanyl-lipoteichoic acid acyltransferase DltB (MBOAT superfamily)
VLFNSPIFLFYFLPCVVGLGLLLRERAGDVRVYLAFLVVASLTFYAYTKPAWLLIIVGSVAVNFWVGVALATLARRRLWIFIGVAFNLSVLAYFKYADFLLFNVNQIFDTAHPTLGIVLPIGISFYTFQQIAYLVDVYRQPTARHRFLDYLLFVSFFPQLIAGPIVHHNELIPQFRQPRMSRSIVDDVASGLVLFLIGLTKKTLLADTFGVFASELFDNASSTTNSRDAWLGVSAYSLQIYFDFSGYSDMAIGLGRMFGWKLPDNFDSPYQARSIVDFWRRWHITLSRFLRDYLYVPLGGNRKGKLRRYSNLLITMLLGGLWHGAGWGFVLWGGLHGVYLCLNHAANAMRLDQRLPVLRRLAWPVTVLAVMFAWVPFRASSMDQTLMIWHALAIPTFDISYRADTVNVLAYLAAGAAIVLFAPNSQRIMRVLFDRGEVALAAYVRPTFAVTVGVAAALGLAINNRIAQFLYFQF